MTTDDYLALITSQHQDKPNFIETVSASVAPYIAVQNVLKSLSESFDIDTATGEQLDILGAWIGRPRRIETPLTGVYFAWDSAPGWESGVWQGAFDPDSGLVDLPDDAYRLLLKAKIAANSWDGSVNSAYDIWSNIFDNDIILLIQDNQDMSIVIGIVGDSLSAVERSLLINGYIPLKPAGVEVQAYALAETKLFGWDAESNALAGWNSGEWPTELLPS